MKTHVRLLSDVNMFASAVPGKLYTYAFFCFISPLPHRVKDFLFFQNPTPNIQGGKLQQHNQQMSAYHLILYIKWKQIEME